MVAVVIQIDFMYTTHSPQQNGGNGEWSMEYGFFAFPYFRAHRTYTRHARHAEHTD